MAQDRDRIGLSLSDKRVLLRDHAMEVIRLAKEIAAQTSPGNRERRGVEAVVASTKVLLKRLGAELNGRRKGNGDGEVDSKSD